MPSTTAEADAAVRPYLGAISPEGAVRRGLGVLLNLVQRVRRPENDDEASALAAIRALHAGAALSAAEQELKNQLYAQIQQLDESQAARIVDWIGLPARHLPFRLRQRRRARRHLLCLTLLVKTAGPCARFTALPVLVRLGLYGTPERVDHLLGGISSWTLTRSGVRLGLDYLDLAASILANREELVVAAPESISADEFSHWPWQRRIMHLLAWRAGSERGVNGAGGYGSVNPVFVGGSFEFGLARARRLHSLGRMGGRVARAALRSLGYRDHPLRMEAPSRWRLGMAIVLFMAAGGCLWLAHARATHFDSESRRLTQIVFVRLASNSVLPAKEGPGNEPPNASEVPRDASERGGR